jgi:hypothetical protein
MALAFVFGKLWFEQKLLAAVVALVLHVLRVDVTRLVQHEFVQVLEDVAAQAAAT